MDLTRTDINPTATAEIGMVVSYEDIANPASFIVLTAPRGSGWGTFWDGIDLRTGQTVTGLSLRGAGWKVAAAR